MKNLHLTPTDKPSKLCKYNNEFYYVIDGIFNLNKEKYNLYITSDEEIKDGDWMIRGNEQPTLVTSNFFWDFGVRYYKIILTTDPDLIADGIQPIDDDFLEWFVENPNCGYVDQRLIWDEEKLTSIYKIIIPKKEPKQDLEKEIFELEQELDIPSHLRWHNSKPKQDNNFYEKLKFSFSEKLKQYFEETPREKILEDWAKSAEYDNVGPTVDDFLNNSKEKMYSEEEMVNFAEFVATYADKNRNVNGEMLHAKSKYDGAERTIDLLEKWFEQFKKK